MAQYKMLNDKGLDGVIFILSIVRQWACVFVTLYQVQ